MHGKGVVHRDMKPSNILYNAATKTLRICDFGLSRTLYDIQQPSQEFKEELEER